MEIPANENQEHVSHFVSGLTYFHSELQSSVLLFSYCISQGYSLPIGSSLPRSLPCISWPWICTWYCKQPMVSRQPREDTAHGSTLREAGLDCLVCHTERLERVSALKAQQSVYLLLHSWPPPSSAQQQIEAGCLSHAWAGQQCFPPTLELSTAMLGAAASTPGVWASLAWLAGVLKPGNWVFDSCQTSSSCWHFLCQLV